MNPSIKKTILWTPRITGILFTLFISIFALDIFDMQLSFWETVVGLFMHLLPTFALAIALILAWRWEWVGAAGFVGFAAWYMLAFHSFDWSVYAILAGIPFIVGILFALSWVIKKQT
jgi:hypothetical protein